MDAMDPNIERLIVRQLDGEITEEELLVLNRELLRNPDAHRLWEAYRELDTVAGEALRTALAGAPTAIDPVALPVQATPRRFRQFRRHWLMAAGAVAAAILALVIPKPTVSPTPDGGEMVTNVVRDRPTAVREIPVIRQAGEGLMRNVGMPQIQRNTGRDVFGVMDENGNIYWIEVDRTRTLRRPAVQDLPRNLRETL